MQCVAASDFDHNGSVVLDFARRHRIKPIPHTTRQAASSSSVTIGAFSSTLLNQLACPHHSSELCTLCQHAAKQNASPCNSAKPRASLPQLLGYLPLYLFFFFFFLITIIQSCLDCMQSLKSHWIFPFVSL